MIGGEFEIDLTKKGVFIETPNTYYYSSGRDALYQILKSINIKHIWLPDYLCVSVVDTVKKAGIQYFFYELDGNLNPKTETLNCESFDAILLINYFGLKELDTIEQELKSVFPNTILIEDDVQAYYEFAKFDNRFIDYRFTSLRKSFAVPDGGLVYTVHKMPNVLQQNLFSQYKVQAGNMKFHRKTENDDSAYLSLFAKGENLINGSYNSVMSDESKSLFASCDLVAIRLKRKKNANYLLNKLEEIEIKTIIPILDNKTPLFIPIWLEKRDGIRRALFDNQIYCPVHWPVSEMPIRKGSEMAEHELSLVIDQRYNLDDMDLIVSIIKENL